MVDFFESITVISLPQRNDRRCEVVKELRKVGVSRTGFSFFDAIRPCMTGGFTSIGYHGCFLSHLLVLEGLSQKAGASFHLILEDDFYFVSNAIELLQAKWPMLNDAELLLLGICKIPNTKHYCRQTFLVEQGFKFIGTHAYAVRPHTARLMAKYFRQIYSRSPGDPNGGPMATDAAIAWFRDAHPSMQTKLIWPVICGQRPSRTDIHELSWFDYWPLVRQGTQLLRKFKFAADRIGNKAAFKLKGRQMES